MKILVRVDQQTALRRGIDAPSSTTHIEVVPSELTELEREVLADCASFGHDATKGAWEGYYLCVVEPTFDGLRSAIAELVARKAERDRKDAQALAAELVPREESCTVGMHRNGDLCFGGGYVKLERSVPMPVVPSVWVSSPQELRDFADEQERKRAEIFASFRPELEALRQAKLVEEARQAEEKRQAEVARKAAYDVLYARLPEGLRRRHADGYAERAEVEREMRALVRLDTHTRSPKEVCGGWQQHHSLSTLTDDEYVRLCEVRKTAPEGAEVEAEEVWDVEWRPAREDEEGDADGEVADMVNVRRVITIRWTHPSGLDVVSAELFESCLTAQDCLEHGARLAE